MTRKKIVILAILIIGLMALPVEAHHKDGHDKGGGPGGLTASVFADSDPAIAGSIVRIKGCDYDIEQPPTAEIEHGTVIDKIGLWVWAQDLDDCEAGRIDFPYQTVEPNTYTIRVFQRGKNKKLALVAEGTFEVQKAHALIVVPSS